MKKLSTLGALLVSLLFVFGLAGCQSTGPNAGEKAGAGAVLGGIAGAVIGHQSGEAGEGAAVGAATGAILGGVIGNSQDKREAIYREEQARIRAERRAQEEAIRQAEAERDIARGFNVTDQAPARRCCRPCSRSMATTTPSPPPARPRRTASATLPS